MALFHVPQASKITGQESLDSRIPEAPLCCALRTNRGLACLQGGTVSLLRIGEARDAAELNNFQMKICIGELFLETQSGFLYFLAQAE